ncbi:MAG: TA system VapC family ribonuclease toxin [Burkholderiales bacterium]
MRALLDINVLIALFDVDHPFHSTSAEWLKQNVRGGWASCPLTQNGCVRIMSQPGYPHAVPASVVIERLREATSNAAHQFWPDDVSVLDEKVIDAKQVHGPRQITDTYLLALAVEHAGRFVTFDAGVALSAVKNATAKNLLVLGVEAPKP